MMYAVTEILKTVPIIVPEYTMLAILALSPGQVHWANMALDAGYIEPPSRPNNTRTIIMALIPPNSRAIGLKYVKIPGIKVPNPRRYFPPYLSDK